VRKRRGGYRNARSCFQLPGQANEWVARRVRPQPPQGQLVRVLPLVKQACSSQKLDYIAGVSNWQRNAALNLSGHACLHCVKTSEPPLLDVRS